jgi:tetratricopeptide (TPR) repeat protein/tRNA A-37 threonylcarbamoyl transferase component Bud32
MRPPDPPNSNSIPDEGETAEVPSTRNPLPKAIGRYHIRRAIAAGGMGTVYEATQDNPRRVVAVKVMRHGIASRTALRRFEYEAQILARLRHPGIAQIYEAGTHDDGTGPTPFFAMEYIPNAKAITVYAEEKKLPPRERLTLFTHVLDAVHHGHQKGIIHRDLKPSNILVDSHGLVRIIDFGVARSTDSDLAVTTLQTDVGQLIGTLQYMSPEQCEADPHDIDIRSDVYALGVVLYELLCGRRPYDVTHLAIHQATRIIREQAPTKLSTINRMLRGDVETIALKALEKERDRRYQSAAELAADIRRYLNNEPIVARRASVGYAIRVFARRNAAAFAALLGIFFVLLVSAVVSTALYVRAERARARAVTAEQEAQQRSTEAETNLARAVAAEALASKEAESARTAANKALQISTFLHDMLASVDPVRSKGRELTVRELLDEAAKTVGEKLAGQPLVEAGVRHTIAHAYVQLGLFNAAIPHVERQIEIHQGQSPVDTGHVLGTRQWLSELYYQAGDREKAAAHFESVLADARRELGDEHLITGRTLMTLANTLRAMNRSGEAEPLATRALEILRHAGSESDLATAIGNLGMLYFSQGRLEKAEEMYVEALDIRRRVLGPDSPWTIRLEQELSAVYADRGDWVKAADVSRRAMEAGRRVLPPGHVDTRGAMSILARALEKMGSHKEAERILLERLDAERRGIGENTAAVCHSLSELGRLAFVQGSLERARSYAVQLQEVGGVLAESRQATPEDVNDCAMMLLEFQPSELRDPVTALPLAQRAVELTEGKNPFQLDTLAVAYHDAGDLSMAIETQKRAVGLISPSNFPILRVAETRLFKFLDEHQDRQGLKEAHGESEQKYATELATRRANHPPGDPAIATALVYYGWALVDHGKHDQAEPLLREALEIRRAELSEGHWRTAFAKSLVGASLAGQGKLDEAEPLLLGAYSAMEQIGAPPLVVTPTLEWMIGLYSARGDAKRTAEWRKRLETLGAQ